MHPLFELGTMLLCIICTASNIFFNTTKKILNISGEAIIGSKYIKSSANLLTTTQCNFLLVPPNQTFQLYLPLILLFDLASNIPQFQSSSRLQQ